MTRADQALKIKTGLGRTRAGRTYLSYLIQEVNFKFLKFESLEVPRWI